MRHALRGALLAALCALAGCNEIALDAPDAGFPSGCVAACPADLVCEFGACVGVAAPPYPVALRLQPRADEPLAVAELRAMVLADPVTELPALPLGARTALEGRALVSGADGLRPIRARASARALYGIDTESPTYTGEIVDRADGPGFVLPLTPFWPTEIGGRRAVVYSLTLRPEEADRYPPARFDDVRLPEDGARIDFELPAADRLPAVEGEVLISEENPNPIEGLRVFAVDAEQRRVSTETTTDATGRFVLRFWPGERAQALVLRVRRAAEAGPLPEVDMPIEAPASADDARPFVRVLLGPLPSTTVVSGRIDDGATPIGGVVARFRGAIGAGVYELDAGPTDAEGRFTATLYPGVYRVDLEPPADAPWRLARFRAEIGPDAALSWILQPRTPVRGLVRDSAGAPLPRARVEARLIVAQFADPTLAEPGEAPPARTRQTETDDEGRFTLLLDPGEHRLHVVPPAESGLPTSDHPLSVPALLGELPPVEVTVPPAAALGFALRGPEGLPATGVVVEAWRTDVTPAARVGEATSADDGRGVLRLPVME
ncbi:MAG: carboxypeptidase regulatory-like domain-containing protein [Myxococcales bacterium]|nr:carboxypeptidase regulatory-like domain-containing protein [Myxococcales bacterium]